MKPKSHSEINWPLVIPILIIYSRLGINVAPGINVAHGTFGKNIKRSP
jgi:hypothetical protein